MSEDRKTARHEAGHAAVGILLPSLNVTRVTRVPKGDLAGQTDFEFVVNRANAEDYAVATLVPMLWAPARGTEHSYDIEQLERLYATGLVDPARVMSRAIAMTEDPQFRKLALIAEDVIMEHPTLDGDDLKQAVKAKLESLQRRASDDIYRRVDEL